MFHKMAKIGTDNYFEAQNYLSPVSCPKKEKIQTLQIQNIFDKL